MRTRTLSEDYDGRYWDFELGPGPAPRRLVYSRLCGDPECLDPVSIEWREDGYVAVHVDVVLGPFEEWQYAGRAAVVEGLTASALRGLER